MKKYIIWLDDQPPANQPQNHMGILLPQPEGIKTQWRLYHQHQWQSWDELIGTGAAFDYTDAILQFDVETVTTEEGEYETRTFNAQATFDRVLAAMTAVDAGSPAAFVVLDLPYIQEIQGLDGYKGLLPETDILTKNTQ